jgi:hypothetical protein
MSFFTSVLLQDPLTFINIFFIFFLIQRDFLCEQNRFHNNKIQQNVYQRDPSTFLTTLDSLFNCGLPIYFPQILN